jgi:moderate conductance mechanosensitive channel
MPETTVDANALESWFDTNLVAILILGGLLIVFYAFSSRFISLLVGRFVAAQARFVAEGSVDASELQKRTDTLESLLRTVLRMLVVALLVLLVMGVLGLWGLLAGLGLFLAALTLAGQPIVLDYLMGVLIILEGQFFKGDVISTGSLAGTVESVGLRRTVIRDPSGTVHSISNGELRSVSNRTRVFANAEVTVRGIRTGDLDRVIDVMARVGHEIAQEPEFAAAVLEAPALAFIDDPDDLGNTAIMRGRVVASERWRVSGELRRRLDRAFAAEGIELNRRGMTPRQWREAGAPRPGTEPAGPEEG